MFERRVAFCEAWRSGSPPRPRQSDWHGRAGHERSCMAVRAGVFDAGV